MSDSVCFKHFLCKHLFFFRPGPPNLGMSRHALHVPQLGFVQPAHLQFDPLSAVYSGQTYMYYVHVHINLILYILLTLVMVHVLVFLVMHTRFSC